MGNRGTKSVKFNKIEIQGHKEDFIVKAQRLDGIHNLKSNDLLRCNLSNFERSFLFRIPPKSINKFLFRFYSTSGKTNFEIREGRDPSEVKDTSLSLQLTDTYAKQSSLLSSSFISGFIDAEGSFSVVLVKDKTYKLG